MLRACLINVHKFLSGEFSGLTGLTNKGLFEKKINNQNKGLILFDRFWTSNCAPFFGVKN